MSYRIILDGVLDADLVRLFGATRELAARGSSLLVNNHGVLSSANLMAQGNGTGNTSSGGDTSGGSGSSTNCLPGQVCTNGIPPHDPYLVVLGAGIAIGLAVGITAGIMIGKSQSRAAN